MADDAAPRKQGLAAYEGDVVAWANEQASLLRAGRFADLDIEHLADEIEDVGKSERRELESRMAVLIAHLLKWSHQPDRRGRSWRDTIDLQREAIDRRLRRTPSLKADLFQEDWLADVWTDARTMATGETGIEDLPRHSYWTVEQIMDCEFFPD